MAAPPAREGAPAHPVRRRQRQDDRRRGRERGRDGIARTQGLDREGDDRDRSREHVAGVQRARMIAAMGAAARELGVGEVTVSDVVARSGVSRRTFYELFEDRDACFLAAFDEVVARATALAAPAFAGPGCWRDRVRGALGTLLEFLDDEPDLGALCIVHALASGPRVLERRAQIVGRLIDAVDEGRAEASRGTRPTRLTAECVVGAVLAVLHARLSAADPTSGPMTELLGPLMGAIVLPYHGQAAAARELSRPAPERRAARPLSGDPLHGLHMRLTYRTMRVLCAVAADPGGSNRQVADAAGVADQGQISKLLARLEHLGLIHNAATGSNFRGEPNAWTLTAKGEEIELTIRQQTTIQTS